MSDMPDKIKVYEKRFGNIAIEKGFITPSDLLKALEIQVQEETKRGNRRLIGQILFELNIISAEQLKQVLSVLFNKETQG